MNYSRQYLFSEDLIEDDEIDVLFSQLQPIAPPATLVDDILASVARLPLPTLRFTPRAWEDFGFVVCHADNELS